MSVTPQWLGQNYRDNPTGNVWKANSTTAGDWTLQLQNTHVTSDPPNINFLEKMGIVSESTLAGVNKLTYDISQSVGIRIKNAVDLSEINFPSILTSSGSAPTYGGSFIIVNCGVLSIVTAPLLSNIDNDFTIQGLPLIVSVSFPSLSTVGSFDVNQNDLMTTCSFPLLASTSYIDCYTNPVLGALFFPSLTACSSYIDIDTNNVMPSVNLSALVSCPEGIVINNNPLCTSILLTSFVPPSNTAGLTWDFSGNALTAASVNHILSRFVANPNYNGGTINLSGGTNSAPTGQGLTDKTTLEGRTPAVTVTVNP